jgi:hypothetical protein
LESVAAITGEMVEGDTAMIDGDRIVLNLE